MRTARLLALGAAGLLTLAACGSSGGSSGSGSGSGYGATTPSTKAKATSGSEVTVSVASGGSGPHLVGPNQHTLYLFEKDQGTTTACTGGCATAWPPLVAEGTPTGGTDVDADALSTAAGIEPNQVTYHGHLLYYFSGDTAPGDMKGVGIPSWYPVGPDGAPLKG